MVCLFSLTDLAVVLLPSTEILQMLPGVHTYLSWNNFYCSLEHCSGQNQSQLWDNRLAPSFRFIVHCAHFQTHVVSCWFLLLSDVSAMAPEQFIMCFSLSLGVMWNCKLSGFLGRHFVCLLKFVFLKSPFALFLALLCSHISMHKMHSSVSNHVFWLPILPLGCTSWIYFTSGCFFSRPCLCGFFRLFFSHAAFYSSCFIWNQFFHKVVTSLPVVHTITATINQWSGVAQMTSV